MIRHGYLIAVVGVFLMGCAVLLMLVGCAGVRSEASQEEQGRTETTKQEQGHTVAAKDQYGSEEARCSQTRSFRMEPWGVYATNDVPGCPKGGLLSGTDGRDHLAGKGGDDKIHGLGDKDDLIGGMGSDFIYGGPGDDSLSGDTVSPTPDTYRADGNKDVLYGGSGKDWINGGPGDDVIYGGDGNDTLSAASYKHDLGADKLYCGPGIDHYYADKLDYVDSSCEKKVKPVRAVGGLA
jgi:hypothetical protein